MLRLLVVTTNNRCSYRTQSEGNPYAFASDKLKLIASKRESARQAFEMQLGPITPDSDHPPLIVHLQRPMWRKAADKICWGYSPMFLSAANVDTGKAPIATDAPVPRALLQWGAHRPSFTLFTYAERLQFVAMALNLQLTESEWRIHEELLGRDIETRLQADGRNSGADPWRFLFPVDLQAKQAWLKNAPSPIEDGCVDAVFDLIRTIYVVYQLRKLLSKLPERVIGLFGLKKAGKSKVRTDRL